MSTQMENIADDVKAGARNVAGKIGSAVSKDGVRPGAVKEGEITKRIESVTANVPSSTFLSAAVGSMVVSALLQLSGRREQSNFVGQWAPTILIMGLYNKLVKLEGSER